MEVFGKLRLLSYSLHVIDVKVETIISWIDG